MIIYYLIQFLSILSWNSNSAKFGVVFLPFLIASGLHSLPTANTHKNDFTYLNVSTVYALNQQCI